MSEIYGVDGSWVTSDELLIPKKDFYIWNLEKKIHTKKKFDLAISLEVAEHISKKSAEIFVENLTKLSDNIVFSAAIPNQGGTGHVNEQWQSYWAEKFMDKGYIPYDIIRPAFHNNTNCRSEYVQNTIVYSKNVLDGDYLQDIINEQRGSEHQIIDYRHPDTPVVKSSQSSKYLLNIQLKLIEAFVKKVLHAMNINTKTV